MASEPTQASPPPPSVPRTTADPRVLGRVVTASLVGTTVEWYDYFLYGSAAALVFNTAFFPAHDPLVGTLLAFATYAIGFRPGPWAAWSSGTTATASAANACSCSACS